MSGYDPCEVCGSTRFFVEEGEGRRLCSNGHVQGREPHAIDEDDEFGTQGRRVRKKEEKVAVKVSRVYRGHKAYKLFLQAYQLILWKQCYALIHQRGLPPETWTIVRDLWTLRLSKLIHRIENAGDDDPERPGQSSERESGDDPDQDTQSQGRGRGKKASSSPVLIETVALCYMAILLQRLPLSLADLYRWIREEAIPYIRAIRFVPTEMKQKLPGEYHDALDTRTILQPDDLQLAVSRLCTLYNVEFGIIAPTLNHPHLLFQYMARLALPLEIYPAVKRLATMANFDFTYPGASSSRRRTISYPEAQLMALVVIAVKLYFPFDADDIKRYPRSLNEPAAQRIDWAAWVDAQRQLADAYQTSTASTSTQQAPATLLKKGEEIEIHDADIFSLSDAQLDQYMDWYQRTWISDPHNPHSPEHQFTAAPAETNTVGKEILDMFPLQQLPSNPSSAERATAEKQREEAYLATVRDVHSRVKMRRPVDEDEAMQLEIPVARPGEFYRQYKSVKALERAGTTAGSAAATDATNTSTATTMPAPRSTTANTSTPTPTPVKTFHEAAAQIACLSLRSLVRAVLQAERRIELWHSAQRRAEHFGEDVADVAAEAGFGTSRGASDSGHRGGLRDYANAGESGKVDSFNAGTDTRGVEDVLGKGGESLEDEDEDLGEVDEEEEDDGDDDDDDDNAESEDEPEDDIEDEVDEEETDVDMDMQMI